MKIRRRLRMWNLVTAWVLVAASTFGCESNPLGDGLVAEGTCNACHGNADNAAPPKGINGVTDPTYPGVGLHQSHVRAGLIRKDGVPCSECHIVPQTITEPGHLGSPPAPVVFGPLASAAGRTPNWDRTTGKCTNVYCHVAVLADGKVPEPVWTRPKTQEPSCDMCHGYPPSATPHAGRTDCNACHWDTVLADGTINRGTNAHMDGLVEGSLTACNSCHGGPDNFAPPLDLEGNTQTTAPGVGAHQIHLRVSNWHRQMLCTDCHIVPANLTNHPRYNNGVWLPAQLTWGTVATRNGANPSYSDTTLRCSNVYCHGSTLRGTGTNRSPQWTAVTAGISCGSCHGIPPNADHPSSTQCNECHPSIRSDRTFINPATHIDGIVEADDD